MYMDLPDISGLGTIMGSWAHPDDETFMTGGLLSMAAANGQKVICVTATDGARGVQDQSRWPAETLGVTRQNELATALNILGIDAPRMLGYDDGHCSAVNSSEVCAKLVSLIDTYEPDTILTFPPDGLTGHPDHMAVSNWTVSAAKDAKKIPAVYFATQTQESYDSFWKVVDTQFNVYFATDSPVFVPEKLCDIHVLLEPEIAEKKTSALKAMPSQYSAWFEYLGDHGVRAAVGSEALVLASKWVNPSA